MITSNGNKTWKRCYVCNNKKFKKIYPNIMRCTNCKLVFYQKIPSQIELEKIYSKYNREEYITEQSKKNISRELSEILSNNTITNVLDIACGECYSLEILRSINPNLNLYATEHESARENVIKKGFKFIEGEFFPVTDLNIDLIIFTEAIEHINDVNTFLKHIRGLLSPNGLVYITTPNFSSLERLLMNENWGMIKPPEHLSYFSKKSLDYAMKKNGFTCKYIRSENISIFRIVEFLNKSKKNNVTQENLPQKFSDKAQSIIHSSSFLILLKKTINFFLNIFSLGSSIKALYKKT